MYLFVNFTNISHIIRIYTCNIILNHVILHIIIILRSFFVWVLTVMKTHDNMIFER
jgi:hypothetical protein